MFQKRSDQKEHRFLTFIKCAVFLECFLLLGVSVFYYGKEGTEKGRAAVPAAAKNADGDFIKWVEFHATEEIMTAAYRLDVDTWQKEIHLNWIELLAYLAARHGGAFPESAKKELEKVADAVRSGETTMEELTKDLEYYEYYKKAYTAALGGFVGEYRIQVRKEDGTVGWKDSYGLKAFSPIARNFYYNDYDDFGASRSFGYARPHLGHDMMGLVGTPIIAVESGYVEALGWNRYGGWRIGIRSFDKKRYYYYAHLRQNFPYNKTLKEGGAVTAGDVIGYMGHTGYSDKENVNNIKTVHLHWGLQLIFDESQKDGNNEIWIDCYELTKFLYKNRSETQKDETTKEWNRVYQMIDPAVEEYEREKSKRIPVTGYENSLQKAKSYDTMETAHNDKKITIIERHENRHFRTNGGKRLWQKK